MKKILFTFVVLLSLNFGNIFSNNSESMFYNNFTSTTEDNNTIKIYISEKKLFVRNVPNGTTIEIYSAIGSRVQISALEDEMVDVSSLTRGLYIIRIGKFNQKILIQ